MSLIVIAIAPRSRRPLLGLSIGRWLGGFAERNAAFVGGLLLALTGVTFIGAQGAPRRIGPGVVRVGAELLELARSSGARSVSSSAPAERRQDHRDARDLRGRARRRASSRRRVDRPRRRRDDARRHAAEAATVAAPPHGLRDRARSAAAFAGVRDRRALDVADRGGNAALRARRASAAFYELVGPPTASGVREIVDGLASRCDFVDRRRGDRSRRGPRRLDRSDRRCVRRRDGRNTAHEAVDDVAALVARLRTPALDPRAPAVRVDGALTATSAAAYVAAARDASDRGTRSDADRVGRKVGGDGVRAADDPLRAPAARRSPRPSRRSGRSDRSSRERSPATSRARRAFRRSTSTRGRARREPRAAARRRDGARAGVRLARDGGRSGLAVRTAPICGAAPVRSGRGRRGRGTRAHDRRDRFGARRAAHRRAACGAGRGARRHRRDRSRVHGRRARRPELSRAAALLRCDRAR